MAMRCSPNSEVGSRIVVIKLSMIYGPVSRSFLFSAVLEQVVFA